MYKILFLEDRTDRQVLFLPNGIEDLNTIKSIDNVIMPEPNTCKKIIEQINQQQFENIDEYNLIIVHRSILKNSGISFLNEKCKNKNIKLVFFSGGISQVFYNNTDLEQIFINSSDFYSERLIPFLYNFCQEENVSILELFHKNWKLSYMMLHRQLTQNLKITKVDNSDPYSYYNITLDRIREIEKIIGLSSADEINKLLKKEILSV